MTVAAEAAWLGEWRRARWTMLGLGAAIAASTVPISNGRALFRINEPTAAPAPIEIAAYAPIGVGPVKAPVYRVPVGETSRYRGPVRAAPAEERAPFAGAAIVEPEPQGDGQQLALNDTPAGFGGVGGPDAGSGGGLSDLPAIGGPGGGLGSNLTDPIPNPTDAVPEPRAWMMMIAGLALIGGVVRRSRRRVALSGS